MRHQLQPASSAANPVSFRTNELLPVTPKQPPSQLLSARASSGVQIPQNQQGPVNMSNNLQIKGLGGALTTRGGGGGGGVIRQSKNGQSNQARRQGEIIQPKRQLKATIKIPVAHQTTGRAQVPLTTRAKADQLRLSQPSLTIKAGTGGQAIQNGGKTSRHAKQVQAAVKFKSPSVSHRLSKAHLQTCDEREDLGQLRQVQRARLKHRLLELQSQRGSVAEDFRVDVDQNLDQDADRKGVFKRALTKGQSRNLFPTTTEATERHSIIGLGAAVTVASELGDAADLDEIKLASAGLHEYGAGGRNNTALAQGHYPTHQSRNSSNRNYESLLPRQEMVSQQSEESPRVSHQCHPQQLLLDESPARLAIDSTLGSKPRPSQAIATMTTPQSTNQSFQKTKHIYAGTVKMPASARNGQRSLSISASSRNKVSTAFNNKDLALYFTNQKTHKNQKLGKKTTSTKVLQQIKPLNPSSLLWVQSLSGSTQPHPSQAQHKFTVQGQGCQSSTSAKARRDYTQETQVTQVTQEGGADEETKAVHAIDTRKSSCSQGSRSRLPGSRSKSRNNNNIYDRSLKPMSELHEQLSQEQERLQTQTSAIAQKSHQYQSAAQQTPAIASKSRPAHAKLFRILQTEQDESSALPSHQNSQRQSVQGSVVMMSRNHGGGSSLQVRACSNPLMRITSILNPQQPSQVDTYQAMKTPQGLAPQGLANRGSGSQIGLVTPGNVTSRTKNQQCASISSQTSLLKPTPSQPHIVDQVQLNKLRQHLLKTVQKPRMFTLSDKLLPRKRPSGANRDIRVGRQAPPNQAK